MNVLSGPPRRYRIVFRGECGDAFAGLFSDACAGLFSGVTVECRHGHTCVVAAVRDASEFYGLLDRFQDLALLPVSINEIDPRNGVSSVLGSGSGGKAADRVAEQPGRDDQAQDRHDRRGVSSHPILQPQQQPF